MTSKIKINKQQMKFPEIIMKMVIVSDRDTSLIMIRSIVCILLVFFDYFFVFFHYFVCVFHYFGKHKDSCLQFDMEIKQGDGVNN